MPRDRLFSHRARKSTQDITTLAIDEEADHDRARPFGIFYSLARRDSQYSGLKSAHINTRLRSLVEDVKRKVSSKRRQCRLATGGGRGADNGASLVHTGGGLPRRSNNYGASALSPTNPNLEMRHSRTSSTCVDVCARWISHAASESASK